jgi:hypothetical protein
MLKSERRPCEREERDGYPFNDIGKSFYLKAYCTAKSLNPYHRQAQAKEDEAMVRTNSVTIGTFGNLIFPLPEPAPRLICGRERSPPALAAVFFVRTRYGPAWRRKGRTIAVPRFPICFPRGSR